MIRRLNYFLVSARAAAASAEFKAFISSRSLRSKALISRVTIQAPKVKTAAAAANPITTSQKCWPDRKRRGKRIHHKPGSVSTAEPLTISRRVADGRSSGGQIFRQKYRVLPNPMKTHNQAFQRQ